MNRIGASDGIWKGYGLVRDKDGKPKIDSPETLPEEIKHQLTADEHMEIYGKPHTPKEDLTDEEFSHIYKTKRV